MIRPRSTISIAAERILEERGPAHAQPAVLRSGPAVPLSDLLPGRGATPASEASKQTLEQSGRFKQPIVTEVVAASRFYPGGGDQNYYQKNPLRYKYYKTSCGRVRRLEEVWGKQ